MQPSPPSWVVDTDCLQIVDWEQLQVYEKFVPLSRRDPMRGTHILHVVGSPRLAESWIASYMAAYPAAGYGTMFTMDSQGSSDTRVVYLGQRAASCD